MACGIGVAVFNTRRVWAHDICCKTREQYWLEMALVWAYDCWSYTRRSRRVLGRMCQCGHCATPALSKRQEDNCDYEQRLL